MTTTTDRLLKHERLIVLTAIIVILAMAFAYTLLGVGMPMSAIEMTGSSPRMAQMMMAPPVWSPVYGFLIFMMWWMMMIAMMIASAAPTILLYTQLSRQTGSGASSALSLIFLMGYLGIWAVFSVIATVMQWQLELGGLVSPSRMNLTSGLLGGLVLVAAGLYQFTRLKSTCLDHCQSPMEFIVKNRRPGLKGAFMMGLEHGTYCVGCCWFLMALLFVGGIMNLYWIAGIAIFIALEKLTPIGSRLAKIAGAGLVVVGLVWIVRSMTGA